MIKPYYQDSKATVYLGDNLEIMPELGPNSIDTIITDPPYGLEFMGKEWDKFPIRDRGKRLTGNGNPTEARGFGKNVAYGNSRESLIAYQQFIFDWATEVLRVAKPGAFLLAFGGTQTFHRLTCAIEDAGWEIRDCMMWLYGSGFPKSLDISKAIDKKAGIDREDKFEGAFERHAGPTGNKRCDICGKWLVSGNPCKCPRPQDAPITLEAQTWDGYGTGLKPAWEPIIVGMKPLDGTFAQNALKWGVGGLWIDGGRVGVNIDSRRPVGKVQRSIFKPWSESSGTIGKGRFPANLILDEEAAKMLDEQSGELKSGQLLTHHKRIGKGLCGTRTFEIRERTGEECNFGGDSGGASRFFYCAKASRSERGKGNKHPTVKPLKLMEYLCKLTMTPQSGVVLDPFLGSGTTALACQNIGRKCIGIEKSEEDCEIAVARLENSSKQGRMF